MFHSSRVLFRRDPRRLSLRFSSKFKRRTCPSKDVEEQMKEFILSRPTESVDSLKSRLLAANNFERRSFDTIFLRVCSSVNAVDLGKRHFRRLMSEGDDPGLATVSRYFILCGSDPEACDAEDRALVDTLYRRLIEKYDGLVDYSTCESLTVGLSAVGRWEEARQWLDKAHGLGAQPSQKMFSCVVDGALSSNCDEDAWAIMDRMGALGKVPTASLYRRLSSSKDRLEKFLLWHQTHDILIPPEVVDVIREASSSDFTTNVMKVARDGRCRTCQGRLQRLVITEDEFNRLRRAFLDSVLIGRDVFIKSRPEELTEFRRFLDRVGTVDVVLDGLNVAYAGLSRQNSNPVHCAKMLQRVVQHFLNQGDDVIVIGRKHMLKWPRGIVNLVAQKCPVFFTEDTSSDDPYLLHATMTSGLGTTFVSRDQMRSHKFLLKETGLARIFSKWRQIHQKHLQHVHDDGKVSLLSSVPYEICTQRATDGTWHAPIAELASELPPHLVTRNIQWICFIPKKSPEN